MKKKRMSPARIEMFVIDILPLLITIILVISLIVGLTVYSNYSDEVKFNNGICPKCGGYFMFYQAVGHMYGTSYVYMCTHCENCIEIDEFRDETIGGS